jgi:hypothetical protein
MNCFKEIMTVYHIIDICELFKIRITVKNQDFESNKVSNPKIYSTN